MRLLLACIDIAKMLNLESGAEKTLLSSNITRGFGRTNIAPDDKLVAYDAKTTYYFWWCLLLVPVVSGRTIVPSPPPPNW